MHGIVFAFKWSRALSVLVVLRFLSTLPAQKCRGVEYWGSYNYAVRKGS